MIGFWIKRLPLRKPFCFVSSESMISCVDCRCLYLVFNALICVWEVVLPAFRENRRMLNDGKMKKKKDGGVGVLRCFVIYLQDT